VALRNFGGGGIGVRPSRQKCCSHSQRVWS
jgi:hypothetical protein